MKIKYSGEVTGIEKIDVYANGDFKYRSRIKWIHFESILRLYEAIFIEGRWEIGQKVEITVELAETTKKREATDAQEANSGM